MSAPSNFSHENASQAPYLPLLRSLVRTYQAFLEVSGRHVRALGLTPSQFDVVATLGNTPGMTLGELATRTLTTKSALTGIIDRLERQGLVARCGKAADRRCVVAQLTPAGEAVFREAFPAHMNYMNDVFGRLSAEEQSVCRHALEQLGDLFRAELERAGEAAAPGLNPGEEVR